MASTASTKKSVNIFLYLQSSRRFHGNLKTSGGILAPGHCVSTLVETGCYGNRPCPPWRRMVTITGYLPLERIRARGGTLRVSGYGQMSSATHVFTTCTKKTLLHSPNIARCGTPRLVRDAEVWKFIFVALKLDFSRWSGWDVYRCWLGICGGISEVEGLRVHIWAGAHIPTPSTTWMCPRKGSYLPSLRESAIIGSLIVNISGSKTGSFGILFLG